MEIVQMVSVTWLLQNLVGSIDGYGAQDGIDWPYMIRAKSWDFSVPGLLDIIERDGCFNDPICVFDDNGWNQGNGHHRLVAAILAGLDEIPVCFVWDGDWMHSDLTSTTEYSWADDEKTAQIMRNDTDWLNSLLRQG